MNVRGFFKNVINSEQTEGGETSPSEAGSTVAGFFSGTSKFIDSMQTKKNGLINELSNKLNSIKFSDEVASGEGIGKKRTKAINEVDNDNDSSASEYGDDGDRPMYAEQTPAERRISVESDGSLPEEEANQLKQEMENLLECVFDDRTAEPELRSKFTESLASHSGRSAFSRELKYRARATKHVSRLTLNQLSELVCAALVQCNEKEDFAPATHLMEASFTVYHEAKAVDMDDHSRQHYLYTMLRDQPIWQSTRFWNTAFFIGLQSERKRLAVPLGLSEEKTLESEKEAQDIATFVQISKCMWRMYSLGIPREACLEFLRKQASAEDLSKEKLRKLQENLRKFYQTQEENVNAIREDGGE